MVVIHRIQRTAFISEIYFSQLENGRTTVLKKEKKKSLANILVRGFKLQETSLENRIISAGSDSPLLSHLYSSTCSITTITKQLIL